MVVKLILRVTCLPFQLLCKSYRKSPVTDEDPIGQGEFTGACEFLFYGYYSAASEPSRIRKNTHRSHCKPRLTKRIWHTGQCRIDHGVVEVCWTVLGDTHAWPVEGPIDTAALHSIPWSGLLVSVFILFPRTVTLRKERRRAVMMPLPSSQL